MTSSPSPRFPSRSRCLIAGLAAGGTAAIAASLASLPLRSPDPPLINSASVTIAILIAGIVAGLVWSFVAPHRRALAIFLGIIGAAFIVAVLAALAIQAAPGQPLLHVVSFCVPLAALSLAILAALTPLFARPVVPANWIAPVAAVVAIGVGVGLAGRGNVESGKLALPLPGSSGTGAANGQIVPKDIAGMTFVVDPSQSKATYSVREQLSNLSLPDDAVGTTSDVTGNIHLDGRPSTVTVGLKTFKSDNPGRDGHLLRDPGLANYAPAQFTVTSLDLPSSYKAGDTTTRQVQGTMTIHDVQKPMTFSVEGRLQDNTLFLHGQTDFTWTDFAIPKPTFPQVLQIADTIHAEVLLVAKAQS